jgi:hypothetical protein
MLCSKFYVTTLTLVSLLTGCFWRQDYKADCGRWYANRSRALASQGYQYYIAAQDRGENEELVSPYVCAKVWGGDDVCAGGERTKLNSTMQDSLNQIDLSYEEKLKTTSVKAFCRFYIDLPG